MAIGALMLNWAQWDSDITHHIFSIRSVVSNQGKASDAQLVSSLHKPRLSMLRRLIAVCTSAKSEKLRAFDNIVQRAAVTTELRGKIAHGLSGLGNPSGTEDGISLVTFSPGRDPLQGGLQASGTLEFETIWNVFNAADQIWDARTELSDLVRTLLR
jgi:hypothetical protein